MLAEKQVVVVGVMNGVASGLRFDLGDIAELTTRSEQCVVVNMESLCGELEQIEKWRPPPHLEHLDFDLHSLWPFLKQQNSNPTSSESAFGHQLVQLSHGYLMGEIADNNSRTG